MAEVPSLRRLHVLYRDSALAVALVAVILVELWAYNPAFGGDRIVVAGLLVAGTSTIAWRRARPLVPAVGVACVLGLQVAITRTDLNSFGWFLVISITLFSVAAYSEIRSALVGLAVMNVGLVIREVGDLQHDIANPMEVAFWTLLGFVWFGLGLYARSRRHARDLRIAGENAEVASAESSRFAVAEERARIAHELHDVVAQDVSAVIVQAEAADALLDVEPDLARESLRKIQRSGREALEEMRRVLGMLDADHPEDRAPQPTLAEVGALVARQSAIGMPAELEVVGTPRELPPGLEVSAYRVVQESLTNVRKHAPGASARVVLTFTDVALGVEVRNHAAIPAPATVQPSLGLIGMRERVRFFGGDFAAGPEAGCFVVRATFPTPTAIR